MGNLGGKLSERPVNHYRGGFKFFEEGQGKTEDAAKKGLEVGKDVRKEGVELRKKTGEEGVKAGKNCFEKTREAGKKTPESQSQWPIKKDSRKRPAIIFHSLVFFFLIVPFRLPQIDTLAKCVGIFSLE
jgi:hypothetical protein